MHQKVKIGQKSASNRPKTVWPVAEKKYRPNGFENMPNLAGNMPNWQPCKRPLKRYLSE